jgi:hypothetical protein
MFEAPNSHKESVSGQPLDAKWYSRFEKIGSFQSYEYFHGDKKEREKQREVFISGQEENPTLDYPDLNHEKISSLESELFTLKKDILSEEGNEVVRQVYRWKINEKLAEVRLLKSAAYGDMRRFRRYSEFIYGNPSQEIGLKNPH